MTTTQVTPQPPAVQPQVLGLRTRPKDIGVALVVAAFLLAGLALMQIIANRTVTFASPDAPISLAYPTTWEGLDTLQPNVLLKVQDPFAGSAFKTALTVESRDLDPANPPTIQQLRDRRVEQLSRLTAYKYLGDRAATIGGQKALEVDYAYVAQPIDSPRAASLPVVVRARDYIILGKDRTYYVSMAAPEIESAAADAAFDRIIESVQAK